MAGDGVRRPRTLPPGPDHWFLRVRGRCVGRRRGVVPASQQIHALCRKNSVVADSAERRATGRLALVGIPRTVQTITLSILRIETTLTYELEPFESHRPRRLQSRLRNHRADAGAVRAQTPARRPRVGDAGKAFVRHRPAVV